MFGEKQNPDNEARRRNPEEYRKKKIEKKPERVNAITTTYIYIYCRTKA